jgi:hypothetical protein
MKVLIFIPVFLFSLLIIGCEEQLNNVESMDTLEKSPSFQAEYMVVLENLTPAGSQPFSPPVLAVHSPSYRIFHMGGIASVELAQIAQDAVNMPLIDLLNNSADVSEVVEGSGVIMPGLADTFYISVNGNFSKLSLVTMLVNTNDGFTGTDKLQLPQKGTKVYYLNAYDAGSEENTELIAHIPGPCCGNPLMGIATSEKIREHEGITGRGDLDPLTYDWEGTVAKLTITRVN